MPREARYVETITLTAAQETSDGYGGYKSGTYATVVENYVCDIWEPSLGKVTLLRTEYGMTQDAQVIMVSGFYNEFVAVKQKFSYNSNNYVVRGVHHVRGCGSIVVATQFIAERIA